MAESWRSEMLGDDGPATRAQAWQMVLDITRHRCEKWLIVNGFNPHECINGESLIEIIGHMNADLSQTAEI